jgi:anti-sigma factor RsiW
MSDHVIQWLSAHLDGELKGGRLRRVEEHLVECEACREELEALRGVSRLLQEIPVPEFTPPEKFAARVSLRLPQRPVKATGNRLFKAGWWLIPIGLLAAWIFFSTAVLVSDMISAADTFGWLDTSSALSVSEPSSEPYWISALSRIGVLQGDSLQWTESMEGFTRNVLPQFIWQVSIALLYLAWIAIGWARRTHQSQVPLLKG